jgi:hypothetical protein
MFYVEYPIPLEFQAHFKKRYERKSTGTSIRQDALRVAAHLVALFEDKFRALRLERDAFDAEVGPARPLAPQVALSEDLIAGLCERWYLAHLHADDRERNEGLGVAGSEDIEVYANAIELDARDILKRRHEATSYVHVCEEARDWAETVGYFIAPNDPAIGAYVQKFSAGKFAIAKALLARNQGEPVARRIPQSGSAEQPLPNINRRGSLRTLQVWLIKQRTCTPAESTNSYVFWRVNFLR